MSPSAYLRDIPPFDRLPAEQLEEVRAAATLVSYPAGTVIFRQNDPPTGFLYAIREGLVAITVLSPDGSDIVVDQRHDGQLFGGTPVFTGEPYAGGARTLKPTVCHAISAAVLQRLQRDNPELSAYFTRMVLSRVRNLYSEIVTEQLRSTPALMEAYPFKKRLAEIMSTAVESCSPDTTVKELARRMATRDAGAVLVVDEEFHLVGMVTEREIVTRVVATESANRHVMTAREIMTPHPPSLPPGTYMYEAMTYMTRHHLKYLPVIDQGKVMGLIGLHDLMRYRSQKAMLLIGTIREEKTLEGLATIRRELLTVANSLLAETRSTPEVMEILSYIHHGIIRRAFELCLERQLREGSLLPDVRYCFLLLGSGGRREMLLGADQDHALVYEDLDADRLATAEAFFAPLMQEVENALQQVGYPLCDGQVMAGNPRWRGRLSDWRERLRDWVANPDPKKVRSSSIFFDMAPLAGDASLAAGLQEIIHAEVTDQPGFLYQMMTVDVGYKVPLGLLGRFVLDKHGDHAGELSLKLGGTLYIVDCVRMFALEKGCLETGTLERLRALVEKHIFTAETAEHIRAAFEALTFLRLRREIALLEAAQPTSHHLDPGTLSKTEQDLLREAFQAVGKLQDATKRYFSRNPF